MFHLHIPATLNFQQPAAPEGKELSTPIYLQSESQTWSQKWFNVHVLSVQSICSRTAGLALPERSQNRLRSGVKRDSAISYRGAFSASGPSVLVEGCFDGSPHLTEVQSKALVQEESGDEPAPARSPQLNL